MAAFDYIKAIRDRLILLLERHAATNTAYRVGNRSVRGDTSRHGLGHKPNAGQPADFPQIEIRAGNQTIEVDYETFADESNVTEDRLANIPLEIVAEIIFEDTNEDRRSQYEAETFYAWHRSEVGRQLKDPDTAASELPYIIDRGVTSVEREVVDDAKGSRRLVTRVTIPLQIQLKQSELNS